LIKEEIIPSKELSIDPLLDKKELDDYDGHNEYDSYCEKVREEILKKTFKNRREKVLRKKENYTKIVEPLKNKIKQRREKKKQLLEGLNKWLEDGEKVIADEVENKQEAINNFINDFSGHLDLMKENADYPTKIISQEIQKDKKNEIDSLITRLRD